MGLTYFRRFRMEIDFDAVTLPEPEFPEHVFCIPWKPELVERHARVKYESFRTEIDANVFKCLGDASGCLRLMNEIAGQRNFLPKATWLVIFVPPGRSRPVDCATIQGLAQTKTVGAVQNVGVIPSFRGYGIGRALMLKALAGFRESNMRRVYLEVTADNVPAVNLYQSLGFNQTRTMYKAAEVEAEPAFS